MDRLEEAAWKAFIAIFNNQKMVEWEGKQNIIKRSARGFRFVNINNYTFLEQNPKKNSIWGKLAREGRQILWILEDGDYVGKVQDKVYHDFRKD